MLRPLPLLILGFAIIAVGFFQLWAPSIDFAATPETAMQTLTRPLIRAGDPKRGNTFAPITLVEFADFSCEACATFGSTISEVLKKFPNQVLHVWKDFPLPIHPFARPQHIAARCALDQGKFWEFHDALFKNDATTSNDHILIAQELKLDTTQFTDCLKRETIQTSIDESIAEGRLLKINDTPTIFLNDKRINGAITTASLTRIIEDLLDTKQ